ncbi:hypothetical protein SHIRM173S_04843 [Streptomyces hirsutus]
MTSPGHVRPGDPREKATEDVRLTRHSRSDSRSLSARDKAGLASLTRTLAGHAGPRGVRVNLVAPGTVRTRAWEGRDEDLAAVRGLYPLGRVGEPEDIAAAVAFLASCDASWITGATLVVDGGVTAVNAGFRQALAGPES